MIVSRLRRRLDDDEAFVLFFSATGGSRYRGVKLMNTPRMRPSPLYNVIGVLSWPVLNGLYRLGREAWSTSRGCVLACNHVSSFDPWPLGLPLWPKPAIALHGEVGALLVAPDADRARSAPFRFAGATSSPRSHRRRLAREGNPVAMFPEGTRRTKGLVKRFEARPRTGAARISLEAGVHSCLPRSRDRQAASFGKIRVAYGRPSRSTICAASSSEWPIEATERLMVNPRTRGDA